MLRPVAAVGKISRGSTNERASNCRDDCQRPPHWELAMAGSLKHVLNEDGSYRGTGLLENSGDLREAVDEMAFLILAIKHRWAGAATVDADLAHYYRCARGEEPWPDWWREMAEK
jgi:hypothetical protein